MKKLNLFFDKIKDLSFLQRIFSWKQIRILSYDAFEEFRNFEKEFQFQKLDCDKLNSKNIKLQTDNKNLNNRIVDFEKNILKKDNQIDNLNNKINELSNLIDQLKNKIQKFESLEEERGGEYQKNITQLNQVKKNLEDERNRLNDERVKEKESVFMNMKKQWSEHETIVEQTIKMICQNHLINYIDKVPFKGTPDNAIEICGEHIIFDAKSPANNDLSNFPRYIKAQTDNVKKYINQENVKKDIFLVVPTNTINSISQIVYNMGDYNVYIITKDSLEPIILSLKKIEDYEFAEQLRPDERDNICRIIGKFAHTIKRRIQIDQFFTIQFIEMLVKCKNDLPEKIMKQVVEFEKAEKLNPPSEKRTKQILTKELQDKNDNINTEAHLRKIKIPASFEDVKKLE